MSLYVGLTGGIGCGKSTVAKMFQDHGALVIDTDQIAHQLTSVDGDAIDSIRTAFGDAYIASDGSLDRARMRKAIFSDDAAKRKLEALLHPLILENTLARLEQAQQAPYVVIVVPLLFNSPAYLQLVQRILVVDCDEDLQVERVMQRNKLLEAEVRAIMMQQTPRQERLRRADDVIVNDGDLASLSRRVEEMHKVYFSAKSQIGD